MEATYFKTREAIDQTAKEIDETATSITVNCACGESYGYYVNGEKLVLCESCYDDTPIHERGE